MASLIFQVNIIPVIAKADTMTPEEVAHFKKQIMNQIVQNKIKIYEFPDGDIEEENEKRENQRMKERVPFAVVGSNTLIENDSGKKVRGRKYPWGVVDVRRYQFDRFRELKRVLFRLRISSTATSSPCATCSSARTCKT